MHRVCQPAEKIHYIIRLWHCLSNLWRGTVVGRGIIECVLAAILILIQPVHAQSNRRNDEVVEDAAANSTASASREWQIDDATSAHLGKLNGSLRGLDWTSESKNASRAIVKVFERNGWSDEPNQFALDVAVKVAAIPPWDLNGRLQAITNAVKDRYELPEESAQQFKSKMFREVFGLIMRNAKVISETTMEAVQTRQEGKPFTREQVAEWCKKSDGFLKDGSQTAERLVKQLEEAVPPDQRDRLHQDWDSFVARQRTMDSMLEKWKNGEWDASQWGMEDDPIQSKGLQKADRAHSPVGPAKPSLSPDKNDPDGVNAYPEPEGGAPVIVTASNVPKAAAEPSHWDPNDPKTWFVFVRFVRDRYKFDPAQITSADSIHDELVERATDYLTSHAEAVQSIPAGARSKSPLFEPVRQLFGELQDRLDSLPTTAQRETMRR